MRTCARVRMRTDGVFRRLGDGQLKLIAKIVALNFEYRSATKMGHVTGGLISHLTGALSTHLSARPMLPPFFLHYRCCHCLIGCVAVISLFCLRLLMGAVAGKWVFPVQLLFAGGENYADRPFDLNLVNQGPRDSDGNHPSGQYTVNGWQDTDSFVNFMVVVIDFIKGSAATTATTARPPPSLRRYHGALCRSKQFCRLSSDISVLWQVS